MYVQSQLEPLSSAYVEIKNETVKKSDVEILQSAIPNLDLTRPRADRLKDATDHMYSSIGFFGWDDSDSMDVRRQKISQHVESHFPKIAFAIGFEFKNPRKEGKLKSSCHATFSTRDEAEPVLTHINSNKLKTFNGKGAGLKMDKSRSVLQKSRWAAVKRAAAQLKKDECCKNFEVNVDPRCR